MAEVPQLKPYSLMDPTVMDMYPPMLGEHQVLFGLTLHSEYKGFRVYSINLAHNNNLYAVELGKGNWQYRTIYQDVKIAVNGYIEAMRNSLKEA